MGFWLRFRNLAIAETQRKQKAFDLSTGFSVYDLRFKVEVEGVKGASTRSFFFLTDQYPRQLGPSDSDPQRTILRNGTEPQI